MLPYYGCSSSLVSYGLLTLVYIANLCFFGFYFQINRKFLAVIRRTPIATLNPTSLNLASPSPAYQPLEMCTQDQISCTTCNRLTPSTFHPCKTDCISHNSLFCRAVVLHVHKCYTCKLQAPGSLVVLQREEVPMWVPTLKKRAERGVSMKGWRCTAQGFKVRRYPRETMVASEEMVDNII